MKLRGIMLGSENPKALGEFYTKIFGEPGWNDNDWYGFMIGEGNLIIGPHSEVKGKSENPARIIINFDSNDVKADFEKIKELGAEVIAEPYKPSKDDKSDAWLATFADPDGNYFQLATPWKS
ncbi:MAG: VOC family protein [Candidatus Saccharimonadales bacterium]